MPESGRGSDEGEDLFEDLDKFFAPIQDVDWPETPGPARAGRGEGDLDDTVEVGEPATTASAMADDEPDVLVDVDTSGQDEEPRAEPVSGPTPGQEDLFTADEATTVVPSAPPSDEDEGESAGAGFLFGETDDLDDDGAITEEAFAQAPAEYVDLPEAEDDDEGAVAELIEDSPAEEGEPDLEAVEAAADHFAESVRDEVRVEPGGAAPGPTEEVSIAELLGAETEEADIAAEPSRTVRVGPEGLGGPSWQEPTALEVGAEPERRVAGRDVPMAFLTGLVLAAVALGAIALGAGPFAIVAGLLVLLAQGEFYFALQKRHYQPATALGLVAGALVLAAGYYRGEGAMIAMVVIGTIATFLWYMTVPAQHRRNVVSNVALTVLGIVYIPMLAAYVLALLKFPEGRGITLSVIGLTIAYDIGAFLVGTWWGSRPLAPSISPKKSLEGAIGATAIIVLIAVGVVTNAVTLLDTIPRAAGLAVVVAIFAPLGDLAESLLKRDLGLKDMGSLLPGHGGVLDRIDAMLFVAPAAFLFLRLVLP